MIVAYTVLFSWPLVVLYLFRQFTVPVAAAASVIGGYLLLPGEIGVNLPMLPTVNKNFIPAFATLIIGTLVVRRMQAADHLTMLPGVIPKPWIFRLLLVVMVAGLLMTSLANGARLTFGTRSLSGLSIYDFFSMTLSMIATILPFAVGRKFLANPDAHKSLLLVLCVACLGYSLLALYEVRMSPQLNKNIYGYSVSGWATNLRGDGFRPFVFLEHGLWLAIFISYSLLATLGYMRAAGTAARTAALVLATLWLLVTLVLVKSLGALIIAILFAPIILFLGVGSQLLAASVIAMTLLTYPALRGAGVIPTEQIVSLAEKIDVNRASSLAFRMRHEDNLLERANQKPLFGWGGWGRSRVYNDKGQDISVTDGRWTLVFGMGGWSRYLTEIGLLTLPIVLLWFRRRSFEVPITTSALAVVLAANLLDLIPNATQTPITWLIAGALAGRYELGRMAARVAQPGQPSEKTYMVQMPQRGSAAAGVGYTRQNVVRHRSKRRST